MTARRGRAFLAALLHISIYASLSSSSPVLLQHIAFHITQCNAMYRPRSIEQGGRWEISPSPEPQRSTAASRCGDLDLPQLRSRPLRRNTRPGLVSASGPQAAQPASRPSSNVQLPGLTIIPPNFRPPTIHDLPTIRTSQPSRAAPAQHGLRPVWSSRPRERPPPSSSSHERPPPLSSFSSAPTPHPAQHPIPHSFRSVGVQVTIIPTPAPAPAPAPVPPSAAKKVRTVVPATPKRAPWRPPRPSTPFRHAKKSTSSRPAPDTAINPPKATTTLPNTATNAPAAALVYQFLCLYSHDLRRKHKRWQDGKLKFHTFNRKYVVQNEYGVQVVEGHWHGDVNDFREGLEIKLDMVWVQVMERAGTKETDLSQVLGKRAREVEERRATRNVRSAPTAPAANLMSPKITGAWSKHAEELLGRGRPIRRVF